VDDKKFLQDVSFYLHPGIKRGPAYKSWIAVMKELAKRMDWRKCSGCDGEGCGGCLYVGYIDWRD
jgi:hypothetical protein